jgi:hypothetical protein
MAHSLSVRSHASLLTPALLKQPALERYLRHDGDVDGASLAQIMTAVSTAVAGLVKAALDGTRTGRLMRRIRACQELLPGLEQGRRGRAMILDYIDDLIERLTSPPPRIAWGIVVVGAMVLALVLSFGAGAINPTWAEVPDMAAAFP